MTREFLVSSSSLLTARHLSNCQTNELVEHLDDNGVSGFFVVVDSNEHAHFPDQ